MTGRLVVAGAINVDLTAYVRNLPRPGESVADGKLTSQAGGKGANQAIAASRLGANVAMVGAVGDDGPGRQALERFVDAGIDCRGVRVVEEPTGTALIAVDSQGENSIVVCPGANAALDISDISIPEHDPLLVQLEIPLGVVEALVRATDGYVAVNLSPAMELPDWLYDRVDLFIVNEGEFAASPKLNDAKLVACTYGAAGAVLLRSGVEIARARSPKVDVVNSVGAGDCFAAALTVGLLRGDEPSAALWRACAIGAFAVTDHRSQPHLGALDDY